MGKGRKNGGRRGVELDYQSVSVWVGRGREEGKREEEWIKREVWSEEAREEFRIRT